MLHVSSEIKCLKYNILHEYNNNNNFNILFPSLFHHHFINYHYLRTVLVL